MRWATRATRAAALLVVAVLVISVPVMSANAASTIDPPAPPVLFPDDPTSQQVYEDGFRTGYSVGADDGFADGRRRADDQSDLRDEVADQADQEPVVEGGQDLGDEITPTPGPRATPPPAATESVTYQDPPEQAGGVPWWPLAFAVAATAWFVTRRRRVRADDD